MSFDSLGLSADILRAVAEQGYSEPTPIQRQAIPVVLAGRDLLASAQTGTAKQPALPYRCYKNSLPLPRPSAVVARCAP